MLWASAQRTRVLSWRARVCVVLCGCVASSCGVPSFNVHQLSAGDGGARDAAIGTSDEQHDPVDDSGRGGRDARGGRGGHSGDGGMGGRGGGVSGRKADRGGEGGGGKGGANDPEGGAGAGGDSGESASGGGGGGGGSSGMPAAVGGNGGGGTDAAGSGGHAANEAPCRNWRPQNETDSFADLGPAPGKETNTQQPTGVSQWICRAKAPDGVFALGKAVPGFGCYATYDSGNTRVGFGATKATGGFEVLVPSSDCPLTWAAPGSGAIELGDALRACRGGLQNEMYPDGTASGTELGQWIVVGTTQQCWTQFHDANGNVDGGSRRLTENVEVLTRAP